ncbi:MAG: L,D-transpeptidase family protein [Chlorobia bacterium]|nr:L,D-transpeptidase family protein [Fimbriimonadaceae bacterium]
MISALFAIGIATSGSQALKTLDGITFNDQPGVLYARLKQVSNSFGVGVGKSKGVLHLNKKPIQMANTRKLLDGTMLFRLGALAHHGFTVRWDDVANRAVVKSAAKSGSAIYVRKGLQRVVINKKELMLVAWQGTSVVLRSKVAIGRAANQTPNGIFKAQAYRTKLHRSSLYGNAPMPWAVHIVGDIFIHGSDQAQGRSSHGCIRLPMKGRNPARWLYSWIEKDSPVTILGKWPKNAS